MVTPAEIERRERIARAQDEASQARALEREARRAEVWREIDQRSQRGHAPHEVIHE
jgi:hypothetical protein